MNILEELNTNVQALQQEIAGLKSQLANQQKKEAQSSLPKLLYTADETAEILGISRRAVYILCDLKLLTKQRYGKRTLFHIDDISHRAKNMPDTSTLIRTRARTSRKRNKILD